VKQFVAKFKVLINYNGASVSGTVTATDMANAEMDWVSDCQPTPTDDAKFASWKTCSLNESGSSKAWISLYTCCVICAVHLELVPDMTALNFICSFRNFVPEKVCLL